MNSRFKQLLVNPEIRNKILAVFFMVLLFRVLAHIPVPIADAATLSNFLQELLQSNRLFGLIDLFSGGTVANFSIAMLGLIPYINASIIMQLMQQVSPKIKNLKQNEGEEGRRKINQYTRYLTLPLAMGQSVGTIFFIRQLAIDVQQVDIIGTPSLAEWFVMVTTITAGSMLLMWLGELISEKGIGNGISILIAASIIAQLPGVFTQAIAVLEGDPTQAGQIVIFAAAALLTTYFIVKLNEAQRSVKVSYAKRSQRTGYGGVESEIPVRLLTAGVIPIIFSVAFLTVPTFIAQIFINAETEWLAAFANNLTVWFDPTSMVYAVTYFVLVVAFTFFYTGIVFNPKDIAENLQKQGGFIPGIRPGQQTEDYLCRIINRVTLFGAISLGIIALLPFIGERLTGSEMLTFGGTGLLIIVSVGVQTMRQLDAQLINVSYEK